MFQAEYVCAKSALRQIRKRLVKPAQRQVRIEPVLDRDDRRDQYFSVPIRRQARWSLDGLEFCECLIVPTQLVQGHAPFVEDAIREWKASPRNGSETSQRCARIVQPAQVLTGFGDLERIGVCREEKGGKLVCRFGEQK